MPKTAEPQRTRQNWPVDLERSFRDRGDLGLFERSLNDTQTSGPPNNLEARPGPLRSSANSFKARVAKMSADGDELHLRAELAELKTLIEGMLDGGDEVETMSAQYQHYAGITQFTQRR
jgi:hypothetical protein